MEEDQTLKTRGTAAAGAMAISPPYMMLNGVATYCPPLDALHADDAPLGGETFVLPDGSTTNPKMRHIPRRPQPDLIRLSESPNDPDSICVTEYYFAKDAKPRGMLTKAASGPVDDSGWGE